MSGKGSKPRPYSPAKHDEGYERIYGRIRGGVIDHGKIDEGVFVEDIWKGDKPHNDYTFEGERIRGIMPYSIGAYKVSFDDQPWIIMDKWKICQVY